MTAAPPQYAWQNGTLVRWDQCVVHARSQGAFWGANVFEGIRGYWNADDEQLYVFRAEPHLARLRRSMKSLWMEVAYSDAQLRQGLLDLVRANDFRENVHLCIVAYFDLAPNFDPLTYTTHTGVHITATPVPRSPAYHRGVAASISSWRRIGDDAMPPRIKTGANYHNSRLAQHEAARNGFDTTLLLNQRGHVSEAPGSCVIMVRDGQLVTPPATSGALEGITVATAAELAAAELGIGLHQRPIDRAELYAADELFLCGTMSELLPIVSVDRLPVGDGAPGPVTRRLQELYDQEVYGRSGRSGWVAPAYPSSSPAAAPSAPTVHAERVAVPASS